MPKVKKEKIVKPQEPFKKHLPLIENWLAGVDKSEGIHRDSNCTLCTLGSQTGLSTCMPSVGQWEEGCLLVVLGQPTQEETRMGQSFISSMHETVKTIIKSFYTGPVYYTYSQGCSGDDDDAVTNCRSYVRGDIDKVKPSRILAFGNKASESLTGHKVDGLATRRAWQVVCGVPTYFLPNPMQGIRNNFIMKLFKTDVKWALETTKEQVAGTTTVIETGDELSDFLDQLKPEEPISIDIENKGKLWDSSFKLLCVNICQDVTAPVVVTAQAIEECKDKFLKFLENPEYKKVNQNIKYDANGLYQAYGVDMKGIVADTMLWARMRETESPAGLGSLSWLVGMGGYKDAAKDTTDDDVKGAKVFENMEPNVLHAYGGRDASCTLQVYNWQKTKMGRLLPTYNNLVGPAFDALATVERNGMLLSADNVRAYDLWLSAKLEKLDYQLRSYKEVPKDFNVGSPKQKGKLLFDDLGLAAIELTKTGNRSTGADALEAIKDRHPIVPIIQELTTLGKQKSTYGLGMLEHIANLDGRVHTTFKLIRTGRLSSSNPNCQNYTRSDEAGDAGSWARGCFIAPQGHKLVNVDFAALELHVAAMLSGDEKMGADFDAGYDFHTMTASRIYKIDPSKVTKTQRSIAKTCNFSFLFGKSAYGVSKDLNIPVEQAESIIGAILDNYPKLRMWLKMQKAQARATGEVVAQWNPLGSGLEWTYRRSAYALGETGKGKEVDKVKKHWDNVATNFPIQCIANCFAIGSLVKIVKWSQEQKDIKVVMTVHDSIVLEVPDNKVVDTVAQVRHYMTDWPTGVVKLKVDAEVGDDWGNMEKIKE